MGRDVKRYFRDLHRFLSVGRLLFFPQEAPFGRPRPVRLARGVRQPVRGSWRWSWRGQGFVEPNRALTKAAFSRQRRQNGAGERHRCGRAFAHRSAIEMTIPCAWVSRFVGTNSFQEMVLSWIWV